MEFAFQPAGAQGTTPAASTQVAVLTTVVSLPLPPFTGKTIRLVNDGTSKIAWVYGASANLSMTSGVLMLANTAETFTLPNGVTTLSVIGSATGSNLCASVGEGT